MSATTCAERTAHAATLEAADAAVTRWLAAHSGLVAVWRQLPDGRRYLSTKRSDDSLLSAARDLAMLPPRK